MPLTTREAARTLGISYAKLWSLIRTDRLSAPPKNSSGDYLWQPADLERARVALQIDRRRRPRAQVQEAAHVG
jgi:hypothetical protein